MRALAALLAALFACGTARAQPVAIRIAWSAVPADIAPLLLEKKDLFRHLGDTYSVETVNFAQAATALRALAAQRIELAALSPVEFAVGVQNAGLDELRILADDYQDGAGNRYSSEFMVRDESPIRTIDQLDGRVVAVEGKGSMTELGLSVLLRQHGLEDGIGYRRVELPPGLMGAMLEGRKIDLASLPAPFSYALRDRGTPRTLFTLKDALGPTQGLMLVAEAQFVERNRDALEDFFEDYLRALRWFLDPDHRDEAVLIAAEFSHLPSAVYSDYLFTDDDYYRDPAGRPNLAALQKTMDMLRREGILSEPIDVGSHADLGPVETAARRLRTTREDP